MAALRLLAERFGYKPCVLWLSEPQREAVRQFVSDQGWSSFSIRDALRAHGVLLPRKGRKKKPVPASTPSPKEVTAPEPSAEIPPRHVADPVATTPQPKPKKPKPAPDDMSQLSLFDADAEDRSKEKSS